MKFPYSIVLLVTAAVTSLFAAPPDVPATIVAEPGQLVAITVKVPVDKDGNPTAKVSHFRNFKGTEAFWGELVTPVKGERQFVYQAPSKPPASSGLRSVDGGVTLTHVIGFSTVGEVDAGNMTTITVTYPPPQPVVPPAPVPVPPTPAPTPTPSPVNPPPIPATGLHVMMIYDPTTVTTLGEQQKAVIYGQDVRDYLRATCPTNAANGNRGWQIWPNNVDASGAPQLWQDAYKAAKAKAGTNNWLVVSNGVSGVSEKLPETVDATMAVLKQYGGK